LKGKANFHLANTDIENVWGGKERYSQCWEDPETGVKLDSCRGRGAQASDKKMKKSLGRAWKKLTSVLCHQENTDGDALEGADQSGGEVPGDIRVRNRRTGRKGYSETRKTNRGGGGAKFLPKARRHAGGRNGKKLAERNALERGKKLLSTGTVIPGKDV